MYDVLDGDAPGALGWHQSGRGVIRDGPAVAEHLVGASTRLRSWSRTHGREQFSTRVHHNTILGLAPRTIRRPRARQSDVQEVIRVRFYEPRIAVAVALKSRGSFISTNVLANNNSLFANGPNNAAFQ